MSVSRLVLLGGGGHARDVLGALEALALLTPAGVASPVPQLVGVLDDAEIDTGKLARWGVSHLGALADLHPRVRHQIAIFAGFVGSVRYESTT